VSGLIFLFTFRARRTPEMLNVFIEWTRGFFLQPLNDHNVQRARNVNKNTITTHHSLTHHSLFTYFQGRNSRGLIKSKIFGEQVE